jgi:UTP--glucose-1-phosphate uridylyltransferase
LAKQTIKKAVLPVAGMGTRFLPATKANPKEMLPVVDKPLIQYAVDEAVAAGVTELIFVTSMGKRAIEDHFDQNYELESKLELKDNHTLLSRVKNILPEGVSCAYIRQPSALGLGHAVWCAQNLIGNEPFAVLLADELVSRDVTNPLSQMLHIYEQKRSPVLACWPVPSEEVSHYGIIGVDAYSQPAFKVNSIIEKPSKNQAPSNYAVVGRYILTPDVFDCLEHTAPGAGGEIQLTDALAEQLKMQPLYGYLLEQKRHDCGNKLGYLKAMVDYGLQHSELGEDFRQYLRSVVATAEKANGSFDTE